jgi:uncharacterized protein YjbJ (UPF0337 family)
VVTPAFQSSVYSQRVVDASENVIGNQAGGRLGMPRSNKSFKTLEQEGDMKPSTKDEVKGNLHEVKGKIKEKVGKVTNNPNLENEGTIEKTTGKVQKKIGQVEKVLGV